MQDKPDSAAQSSGARTRKTRDSSQGDSYAAGSTAGAGSSGSPTSGGAGPSSSAGVADQAKETISNVASQAGNKVASRLNSQKDRAAQGLGSVAQALRQTGDRLEGESSGAALQEYVSSAADQVERLSDYLRSTEIRDMVSGVEQFARRQPALFIGGAFMLGLLGARFLKSSSRGSSTQYGSIPRSQSLVPGDNYAGTSAPGAQYSGAQGIGNAQYPRDSYTGSSTSTPRYSGAQGTASAEYGGASASTPDRGQERL